MFAAIFILSDANKTLPVGMAYFLEQYFIDWGLLMSSSVLIALPAIIVFAIAGRYFVEGLTASRKNSAFCFVLTSQKSASHLLKGGRFPSGKLPGRNEAFSFTSAFRLPLSR